MDFSIKQSSPGLQSESEGSGTYKSVSLVGRNSNHLFKYLSSKQETL